MIYIKKYRHKPIYKKFINLKKNIQNRQKLLKFRKRKWNNILFTLNRQSKIKKYNCYYKFYNQSSYNVSRFNRFFSKNFKQNLITKKSFNLSYGYLGEKYLKMLAFKSSSKSNQISNKINLKNFFSSYLEKRLDVILVRSNLVLSIRNARQLITHGHVFVNETMVKENAFSLKKGDVITFSKKTHKLLKYYLGNSPVWPLPPTYLQISYKMFQILIIDNIFMSNMSTKFFIWLNLNDTTHSYKK